MSAKLTNDQKRYLSQLSDRAFRLLGAKARGRGEVWPPSELVGRDSAEPSQDPARSNDQGSTESRPTESEILKRFRHAEVAKACGKLGLRCCSQDDYGTVKAHFLSLLGEDGRALKAHVEGANNPDRIAEWKLSQEIDAAAAVGITRRYAEEICKRQFGCTILEATTKQKWNLMFTIRNRAAAKRKGQAA